MTVQKNLDFPWSMEDTIENLKELKEILQEQLRRKNYEGQGERDVKEIALDFDRAIQALEEVEQYRALGTVEELKEAREKQISIGLVLDLAWRYGQIDGAHHKMWVIDQMVRALCGSEEEYKKWVSKYTDDDYDWDCGIAP